MLKFFKVSTAESPLEKKYREYKHTLSIGEHMVFDEMVNLDENSVSKEELNKIHSKHNWKTISNLILKTDDHSFKKFLKNVSKKYYPNKNLQESFKKISKIRKKNKVKPVIRNSSIRNSYIQTIPRKKTVFAQKSHDNMITTIEPLEKISRTSLKFDLITVPEFGASLKTSEMISEATPQANISSVITSKNQAICKNNKANHHNFASYFKKNFKNRRKRIDSKGTEEQISNSNAYCYLKTNSSLCIPKSQEFLNRFLHASHYRPPTIIQKQKKKIRSRCSKFHCSVELKDRSLTNSEYFHSNQRPGTSQERWNTRPAIPPPILLNSIPRVGSSCAVKEMAPFFAVSNDPLLQSYECTINE